MKNEKPQNTQIDFFEHLNDVCKDKFADKLVTEVSKALQLSESGAYKKISGAAKLSFQETYDLCKYFDVSFDQFVHSKSTDLSHYPFYTTTIQYSPRSYLDFIENFLSHSINLDRDRSQYKVYCFANEVPIFHYLAFPHLLYFKLFVWNKTNWNIAQYGSRYDISHYLNDIELTRMVKKLSDHYQSYDSTEIWNIKFLQTTLLQLSFYTKAMVFEKPEDIIGILNDIKKLVRNLKAIAEKGKKLNFSSGDTKEPIEIYLNEIVINSEIIYIKTKDYRIVYNSYDTPNYLRSDDDRICDHMEKWLHKIIKQSILISNQAERERNATFNALEKELEQFEQKLMGYIQSNY